LLLGCGVAAAIAVAAAPAWAPTMVERSLLLPAVSPAPFELGSFQWGGGRGGASSPTNASEIVITKSTDSASPLLFRAAQSHQHFPGATLTEHNAAGAQTVYQLSDVWVSEYRAGGTDRPTESLSLSFARVETRNLGDGSVRPAGGAAAPWTTP